jgi:TPR repeat protein
MGATGFVGYSHPGQSNVFWDKACHEGKWNACGTWAHNLEISCGINSANDCLTLGLIRYEGRLVPRDPLEAGKSLGRACDLGQSQGCLALVQFVLRDGGAVLRRSCDKADGASCFILGSLYHNGDGIPKDDARALTLFRQSCANGWWRGCGRLGESYLWGEGTAIDTDKAVENFEKACQGRHAASCFNVALLYRRGTGTIKDESLAKQRLRQACEFGLQSACRPGETPATDASLANRGGSE